MNDISYGFAFLVSVAILGAYIIGQIDKKPFKFNWISVLFLCVIMLYMIVNEGERLKNFSEIESLKQISAHEPDHWHRYYDGKAIYPIN